MTKETIAAPLIRICVGMGLNCLNLLHCGIRKMEARVEQLTGAGKVERDVRGEEKTSSQLLRQEALHRSSKASGFNNPDRISTHTHIPKDTRVSHKSHPAMQSVMRIMCEGKAWLTSV